MKRHLLLFTLHLLIGWFSLRLAFELRFYLGPIPSAYEPMMHTTLLAAPWLKALAAEAFGLTRRVWKYATFQDIRALFAATILGSLLLVATVFTLYRFQFPKGPLLLDFLLTFTLFAALRFSGRACHELRRDLRPALNRRKVPVLIIGASDLGELALRFSRQSTAADLKVKGFIDDDPACKGAIIHGAPVLGTLHDLPRLIRRHRIGEAIIALPNPSPKTVRHIFDLATAENCKVSILPERSVLESPTLHHNPIRTLHVSDFLQRPPVELDPAPLRQALATQRVLVTGAGGSIGAELSRQIARFPIERLILLDFAETPLFEIHEELQSTLPQTACLPALCDIRDPHALEHLFQTHQPHVVFHAAACKHVPMMELHPADAVRTNIFGTLNLIRAAQNNQTPRLLHVSTDKVVHARSIMGATKAISEQIVLHAAPGRAWSCVRFGNVLGSNGSVLPLFEKQLARGGPLKVTHQEATRYFMTISEAVQLMLHAESLQSSGEIYVLDMGEPVRILDLARQMARFQRRPDGQEVDIQIIGLRPGEKLHETLLTEQQHLTPTPIPKVSRIQTHPAPPHQDPSKLLQRLTDALHQNNPDLLREALGLSPHNEPREP